jgi:hypothetical protein
MQGRDAGLTPQEKLEFWTGLAAKLKDSSLRKAEFEMLVYGSERSLPIRDRSGKIVGFREVQGGGGDASLAVFALPRWTPWAIGGAPAAIRRRPKPVRCCCRVQDGGLHHERD